MPYTLGQRSAIQHGLSIDDVGHRNSLCLLTLVGLSSLLAIGVTGIGVCIITIGETTSNAKLGQRPLALRRAFLRQVRVEMWLLQQGPSTWRASLGLATMAGCDLRFTHLLGAPLVINGLYASAKFMTSTWLRRPSG